MSYNNVYTSPVKGFARIDCSRRSSNVAHRKQFKYLKTRADTLIHRQRQATTLSRARLQVFGAKGVPCIRDDSLIYKHPPEMAPFELKPVAVLGINSARTITFDRQIIKATGSGILSRDQNRKL